MFGTNNKSGKVSLTFLNPPKLR